VCNGVLGGCVSDDQRGENLCNVRTVHSNFVMVSVVLASVWHVLLLCTGNMYLVG
jgi:hypothetical protein